MGGPSQSSARVHGNKIDPKAYLKIEYCGAWGYSQKVKDTIEEIEKVLPKHF